MARGGDGGSGQPPTPLTNKSARFLQDLASQDFSQAYTAASRPVTPSRGASYRTVGTPSTSSLVDAEHYRRENLAERNGIELRDPDTPLPSALQALVDSLGLQQTPPTPTAADEKSQKALRARNNCISKPLETFIRPLFDDCIFPKPLFGELLLRIDSLPMKQTTLPTKFSPAALKKLSEEVKQLSRLSIPTPDILYGYYYQALPAGVRKLLSSVLKDVSVVNTDNTVLPFLVVEFKGDGGSMWSCVNQCLGGSAACVNVGQRLNIELSAKSQSPTFNSAVFSISINQEHANLYVSWRPESDPVAESDSAAESDPPAEYYMQRIGVFATEDMHHHLILQRAVRKIIDWGMGPRLDQIRECLGLAGSKKRKQLERPSADVKELESQLKEPKTQGGGLKTQVEEHKAPVDKLKALVEELKTQGGGLKTQVEEPKAQVEEHKALVDKLKALVEELKTQVEEPQAQVEGSEPSVEDSVPSVGESVPSVKEHVPLL
ncbi:hypothetical protein G3M48_006372 [Beauveria asiatica]|uniref:DUF7924 domain-containing protein n=1 Tax=Beauveria asiatica TaxID=1069075 RepID=A0AAW0RPV8_9HYPO